MTHLDKYYCDNCKEEIENIEASNIQLEFILKENWDDGITWHFCSPKCLIEFSVKQQDKDERWLRNEKRFNVSLSNKIGDLNKLNKIELINKIKELEQIKRTLLNLKGDEDDGKNKLSGNENPEIQ